MDIKFSNDIMRFSLKSIPKEAIHSAEDMARVVKIIELCKEICSSDEPIQTDKIEVETDSKEVKEKVTKAISETVCDDKPIIRNRIPNTVDLGELTLSKLNTKNVLTRCPLCGQSYATIAKTGKHEWCYLRSNIKNNGDKELELLTVIEDESDLNLMVLQKEDTRENRIEYCKDIRDAVKNPEFDNKDVVINEDTILICPMCQEESTAKEWIDCYKDPLKFHFETDSLCEVCGGELTQRIEKESSKTVFVCEKCGLSSPHLNK